MFNKSFGLIATVALVFSPLAAFAGETQINSQNASNSAVAVGSGNTVVQNVDQTSIQDQFSADGYYKGSDPQLQINQQNASNSGAAIGHGNTMIQNVDQFSGQFQNNFGF